MDVPREVVDADRRIDPYVHRTPVVFSRWLSDVSGARVHLKMENFQHTGSFKFRGAMNKLLAMDQAARKRGVVAASTGNHGLAVAHGAAELGCPAVVFAPSVSTPDKLRAIRDLGAEVRLAGNDCLDAETAARRHAAERQEEYVSPYNDPHVVAGQGTIGCELERQLDRRRDSLDVVFAAVGGGGLIGGIGGYLKRADHDVTMVGVSPASSAVMHASLAAGRAVECESLPTLSDATAGGIEPESITFPLCQNVVDDFVLVSEDEIRSALRETIARHHALIEGAAAAAIAGFLATGDRFRGQGVVIVLCGANLDAATLRSL